MLRETRRAGNSLGKSKKARGFLEFKVDLKREKKHNVLNFSEKVKENESIIDLYGFCWVFSITKSAFRNIYIC